MPPRAAPNAERAARSLNGPRLRVASAGYDIDQWPLSVPPYDDELAQSWLARVAWRYGTAPTTLLRTLRPRIEQFSVRHFDSLMDDLANATRTRVPGGNSMVESEVGRWARSYARRIARTKGPSFCPACLAEPESYWRQSWAHPLSFVCSTHRCLLVVRCPGCGGRPHSARYGTQRPTPPWMCPARRDDVDRAHRVRRTWCGTDLRHVSTSPAGGDELAAATRLADAIDLSARRGREQVEISPRGLVTTRTEYLDALLELIDEQIPATMWPSVERDTILSAVHVATRILDAASATETARLCEQHGVMDPVGRHTPLRPTRLQHPRNRLLMAVRLQSLAPDLPLASRLEFRTASKQPRVAVNEERRFDGRMHLTGRWPAHGWVPPVLWPGVLDGLGLTSRPHAGAALSIALSKIGSNTPPRAIAVALGLPGWIADHMARVLRAVRVDALCESLEDLFARLEQNPPPIDYAKRVMIGRDPTPFTSAVDAAIEAQGVEIHATARDVAAIELWATYTGSSPEYCPWGARAAAAQLPWFVDRLNLLAQAYLELPHHSREPMVWTPP